MWQAEHVQARLRELYPQCSVEILGLSTEGDRVLDRALNEIGGKGLFIKELEVALLDGRADLAVHSLKDVPMEMVAPFELSAIMRREDPRDAFVSNRYGSPDELPAGARVGTSSLRRAAQLRHRFPTLQVLPCRGNVNTRLAKLDADQYDAIILAAAGLKRLGLAQRIRMIVPPSLSLPSPGQGALGIETLAGRSELRAWLAPLVDARTTAEVGAERMVSRVLGGSCRVPLAAYCVSTPGGGLKLIARVAAEDGSALVESVVESAQADPAAAEALGLQAAQALREQGAAQWLASS